MEISAQTVDSPESRQDTSSKLTQFRGGYRQHNVEKDYSGMPLF